MFLSLSLSVCASAQTRYRVIDLGIHPEYSTSYSRDINYQGFVAGESSRLGGRVVGVWEGSSFRSLTGPNGREVRAYAINDSGTVAGNWIDQQGYESVAVWSHDGATFLPRRGIAYGVNRGGDVVGHLMVEGNEGGAFLYRNGTLQYVTPHQFSGAHGISDAGHVVGWTVDGSTYSRKHAFVWLNGALTLLDSVYPSYDYTAYAVNDLGWAVGVGDEPNSRKIHSVLWRDGQTIALPTFPNELSVVADINNNGQIVGQSRQIGTLNVRGWLWQNGQLYDLNTLLDASSSHVRIWDAVAINDRGWIAAQGSPNVGSSPLRAMILVPVNGSRNGSRSGG